MYIKIVSKLIAGEKEFYVGDIVEVETKNDIVIGELASIFPDKIVVTPKNELPHWITIDYITDVNRYNSVVEAASMNCGSCTYNGNCNLQTIKKDMESDLFHRDIIDTLKISCGKYEKRKSNSEYIYETVSDAGVKYSFKNIDERIVIYIEDVEWGITDGDRFVKTLLRDIKKLI